MDVNDAQPTPSAQTQFLTEKQVAARWQCSAKLLQKFRYQGGGPRYMRFAHNMVRYSLSDLVAFENGKFRSNTSEEPGLELDDKYVDPDDLTACDRVKGRPEKSPD